MLVVSQPPLLAFLVFLLSDWWEACATSPAHSCARSDQTVRLGLRPIGAYAPEGTQEQIQGMSFRRY